MILWWWHKVTSGTVFCAFYIFLSWWRHHMETFSALLALCAGNSPDAGDLRRHGVHDITATMSSGLFRSTWFIYPCTSSLLHWHRGNLMFDCPSAREITRKDMGNIRYSNIYRQFSNISRIQSQNINVSRPVLQLSLSNPFKPGVKLRMKM